MEYLNFSPIPTAIPTTGRAAPAPFPAPRRVNFSHTTDESIDVHQLLTRWADGLGVMKGGTYDEWVEFVDEHFVQDARFSLGCAGEDMRIYDIPASLLPRVLLTISEKAGTDFDQQSSRSTPSSSTSPNHIHIHRPVRRSVAEIPNTQSSAQNGGTSAERPPGDGGAATEGEDTETFDISWYFGQYFWRGSISAEVVEDHTAISGHVDIGGIKFTKMGLVVVLNEGDVIPEAIIRVLEVSQTMEHLSTILEIQRSENISPNDALKKLLASEARLSTSTAAEQHHADIRENGHGGLKQDANANGAGEGEGEHPDGKRHRADADDAFHDDVKRGRGGDGDEDGTAKADEGCNQDMIVDGPAG
ncbi:hypothetical protein I316_06349 [Kwoniella heveanensis BCC8398]|uniref:Uncharacterized protein n=1 Tax=Kwoniella heveanensis BCC8398 TaxID=1296120 RepID=A0A1B9GM75_9TREE|nr:hypothetical protein I316_06349 [Kwoniella heveanensis BCC8398]